MKLKLQYALADIEQAKQKNRIINRSKPELIYFSQFANY